MLNYQVQVPHTNWFDLTPLPLSVFPVTILITLPHRIQAHNLLQKYPLLLSRTCNRPCLPPKELKSLHVPIHLSYHFSVRTHHKGTLKPKLWILIYSQDEYLRTTSNVNLLPIQSPNVKILFKYDMLFKSQTRITAVGNRALPICYRINKSSKLLLKVDKLTFTKIQW